MPKAFAVGDRVLVRPAFVGRTAPFRGWSNVSSRCFDRSRPAENSPGTVRFAGQTKFAEGEWFGVELEKPLGKNDAKLQ